MQSITHNVTTWWLTHDLQQWYFKTLYFMNALDILWNTVWLEIYRWKWFLTSENMTFKNIWLYIREKLLWRETFILHKELMLLWQSVCVHHNIIHSNMSDWTGCFTDNDHTEWWSVVKSRKNNHDKRKK